MEEDFVLRVGPETTLHELGYVHLDPIPTSGELRDYYANKYYQEPQGSYGSAYSDAELTWIRAKLEQKVAIAESLLGAGRSSRFLDVGCGEGWALALMSARGYAVRGMDYSDFGVRVHNPSYLEHLVVGDVFESLEREAAQGRQYDLVWLQHVLEHVVDPLRLLELAHPMVDSSGLLVVTVPNDFSSTQLAAKRHGHIETPFWLAPPEHINYFNGDTLPRVFNATDWTVEEVISDFPIDWFLYHDHSNYVRDASLGKGAHIARVQIETDIHQRNWKDVVAFYSAAAKIGVGRNLTYFLSHRTTPA